MLTEWENTLVKRVPDLVDVTLYRADGSRAGSIQDGGLSDGQRNTAALALLLAQGNDPIVIDQPEDELDSSFIYRDLVPMLRRMKEQRQLIFATHNANLPVNGDAELVYALETRNGRGRLLAEGGLDRPGVCGAVLDVMEGSKEAFQRRREKYHF
jgi:ABC-type Mn2+/Zn2+ transport system ATPase subunit